MAAGLASLRFKTLPDHLKVPWRIVDALIVYAGAWLVLPILIEFTVLVFGSSLPGLRELAAGLRANNFDGQPWANSLVDTVSAAGGLGLVYYYLRRSGVGWPAVGWRGFSFKRAAFYFLMIFVLFIVLAAIAEAAAALIPGFNSSQAQTTQFTNNGQSGLWAFLSLVVVPPILEETVFRGFIFPAFAKRWGVWRGAIASSVLFGFAHLQGNISVYTFVLGMFLCYMYTRLRSVFPGMALHMFNNYLAFVAMSQK